MNRGVRPGLKGEDARVATGVRNGVQASGIIVPRGPDDVGLLIQAVDEAWGLQDYTAAFGSDRYGTGGFLLFLKPGGKTASDSIMFRVDRTGGSGQAGGSHLATGLNQPPGYSVTQCFWVNPYINTNLIVGSAPSVANSATWDQWFLIFNSDRSGTSRNLFWVDQYGIVNAPNSPPGATRYRLFEHFERAFTQTTSLNQIGGSAASTVNSGTGSGVVQIGHTIPGRPGVADSGTGTTTTGFCAVAFYEELFPFIAASSDIVFGAAIQIPTASDGTNTFEARVGLCNTFSNSAPTDGLYFRWQSADANWEAVNARGGVETVTDTGVAGAAGSWVNFKIRYTSAGGAVYTINGVDKATISTNKPTDATSLIPLCGVVKSAGTTARHIYVDAMNLDLALDTDLEQILA